MTMAQFEVKKMKQGMSYSCKEKTIILNVFKYFRQQLPDKCITELVRRTAKATGCSEKSIFQFRKEEASVEGFREPSKTKIRKNININSRDIKYDSNVRQSIREIIYELKYRNVIPSLNTILKQVNADAQLPNFSVMTLRRLLFDMGFYYEKSGNKSILVERDEKDLIDKVATQKSCNNKKVNNGNSNIDNTNSTRQVNSEISVNNKGPLSISHETVSLPPSHMPPMNGYQGHRIMHVHVTQPESHMMACMQPPHNMPMMMNHRTEFMSSQHPPPPPAPPSLMSIKPPLDLPIKRDNSIWMQAPPVPPPLRMIKQQ